jgi:hypothetical protein
MKLEITDIINKHKNQPAFVMGLSSSLNPYIDRLGEIKSRGYLTISCNRWHEIKGILIDYWVLCSNLYTIKAYCDIMNQSPQVTVFYADSADNTLKEWIETNLENDWLGYDERNFTDIPYNGKLIAKSKCFKNLIPGRLTLQEELKKISGHNHINRSVGTVAIHMIAFALIMGCNPIYLSGIDIDYSYGYAKGIDKQFDTDVFETQKDELKEGFRQLGKHAEAMGVKIYDTGEVLKVFEEKEL